MKGVVGVAIVLALTAAAGAKPAPVGDLNRMDDRTPTLARNDADIDIVPAARERSYFQAPQQHFNTGNVSCRLQLSVFDKTRIAQSCN
ncbi:MAG: hypothetical protein WAM76_02405 [Pseudolabrys sp.]|jgi:hypothetical protein